MPTGKLDGLSFVLRIHMVAGKLIPAGCPLTVTCMHHSCKTNKIQNNPKYKAMAFIMTYIKRKVYVCVHARACVCMCSACFSLIRY